MKKFYLIGGGVLVVVALTVVLWPGLGDSIEGSLLRWLAGNAR